MDQILRMKEREVSRILCNSGCYIWGSDSAIHRCLKHLERSIFRGRMRVEIMSLLLDMISVGFL